MELTVLVDPGDFSPQQEEICTEIVRLFGLDSVFISGTYFSTQQLKHAVSSLKQAGYSGGITIVPSSLEHILPLSDSSFGIPVLLNSSREYDSQSQQAARILFAKKLKGQMYGMLFFCDSTATKRVGADPAMDGPEIQARMAKHDIDTLWLDFEGGNGVDLSVVSWFKQFNKKLLVVTDVWDKPTLAGLEALGVDQVLLADVFKTSTLQAAADRMASAIPCKQPQALEAGYRYS